MFGFDSSNCSCSAVEDSPVSCSESTCEIDPKTGANTSPDVRPMNVSCIPGPTAKCSNENGFRCPMLYFSYHIQDPISALGNVVAGGANAGRKMLDSFLATLLKYLKWGAIIVGVLLVLYIILKIVENYRSDDNNFGKNCLGNLNKFSAYATKNY